MRIRQGFEEKSRLGRLLINRGYLSGGQVNEGLRLQRETGQRLGEVFIQEAISPLIVIFPYLFFGDDFIAVLPLIIILSYLLWGGGFDSYFAKEYLTCDCASASHWPHCSGI